MVAHASTLRGYCGNNVQWEFQSDSGELVISGSGAISEPPAKAFSAKVTSLVIEEGISKISEGAFSDLTNIQELYLPESVSYIERYAFFYCENLSKVIITNPDCMLADTSSIFDKNTVIFGYPESTAQQYAERYNFPFVGHIYSDNMCRICKEIGENLHGEWDAFTWLLDIQTGHLEINMQNDGDGSLCSDGWGQYRKLVKSATIVGSISLISDRSFSACRLLERVEIASACDLAICDEAFQNCCNLQSVSIEGSVKRIGEQAFNHCSSLRGFLLPEGLNEIEKSAFAFSGLVAVKIPDSVTQLGELCFRECENLQVVILGNHIEDITDVFLGCNNIEILQCKGIRPVGIEEFVETKNCSLYYPISDSSWTMNTQYQKYFQICSAYNPQDLATIPISDESMQEIIENYENKKIADAAEYQRFLLETSRDAENRFSVLETSRITVLIVAIVFSIVAVVFFVVSVCIQKKLLKSGGKT